MDPSDTYDNSSSLLLILCLAPRDIERRGDLEGDLRTSSLNCSLDFACDRLGDLLEESRSLSLLSTSDDTVLYDDLSLGDARKSDL
mmetsp:Transcript_37379/g.87168  ORF Transcript_37379/g.87168 Transcript_37379/m.87168 type:complete len:86 (-) Transcript_37379:199-456(-)